MSRSRRKAIIKHGYGTKWKKKAKKTANSSVKAAKDISTKAKGAFKKEHCSWDICDYKFDERFNNYEYSYDKKTGERKKRPLTKKEAALRVRK